MQNGSLKILPLKIYTKKQIIETNKQCVIGANDVLQGWTEDFFSIFLFFLQFCWPRSLVQTRSKRTQKTKILEVSKQPDFQVRASMNTKQGHNELQNSDFQVP